MPSARALLCFCALQLPAAWSASGQHWPEFITGVDLSGLPGIEDHGGLFTESGIPRDALSIFKDHGVNFVRLRIWHSPAGGYSNLDHTLLMAQRAKAAGLGILLDFHYSDSWADPGQQTKPSAWQGLSFQELKDSVYHYTHDVIACLKNNDALPDMVQLGNEITCGLLWDEGRVCGEYSTPQQWAQLADLLREGIRGLRDSLNQDDTVRVMIHVDRGGDNGGSRWFFDNLLAQNLEFELIGLSYYPWWHGTTDALRLNLQDIAQRYGKDVVLVETAYPWTLGWNDNTQNVVGDSSQLHPGYPATVDGQRRFLRDVREIVRTTPQGKGVGVFSWAPEWISAPGQGSPWENLALFDFAGEVLSSISAFDSLASVVSVALRSSWNLLSVPVEVENSALVHLFPSAISSAFAFSDPGYSRVDTLVPNRGYWVKFDTAQSVFFAGRVLLAETVDVRAGWNLLGTLTREIPVSTIITDPPGLVTSAWFEYGAAGYTPSATLRPGRGYWVKLSGVGRVLLRGE